VKKLILAFYSLLAVSTVCVAQLTNDDHIREMQASREREQKDRMRLEQYKVILTHVKNIQGNYDFNCENKLFCNYILEVTFTDLQNLQSDVSLPVRITVAPGTRRVFTLRKITNGPVHISYRYKYFKGCTDPKPDTAFTYLLPVAPGKQTRIFELYYIAKQFGGESEPQGWYAAGFHVHSGDTVFAARSGRVTETLEQADLKDTGISYARGENFVEICHNDCSFARYRVFKDSSIFVHAGDWVEAGQPLGIAGGDKYASGPQVQFSVYYNHDEEVTKNGEPTEKIHHWAYIPLQFWTKGQRQGRLANHTVCTSEHPADLVTQEMSKKEAKKWASNHKS